MRSPWGGWVDDRRPGSMRQGKTPRGPPRAAAASAVGARREPQASEVNQVTRRTCPKMDGVSRTRFAPTTSGPAHPGTLVAGLLAWLDARSRGGHVTLRLEDVDPARCTPASADDMRAALRWFGLDWDAEELQSANRPAHEAALDRLAGAGLPHPRPCRPRAVSRG